MVLLRNSARDSKKGDKLVQRWIGPYKIIENIGKGRYRLNNSASGQTLKKAFNRCRCVISYSYFLQYKYLILLTIVLYLFLFLL